jgi:hypothetical protein
VEKMKENIFFLGGGGETEQSQGKKGTPFFSATDGLNLFKDALVKRKFISLSEVKSFYSFY